MESNSINTIQNFHGIILTDETMFVTVVVCTTFLLGGNNITQKIAIGFILPGGPKSPFNPTGPINPAGPVL